MAAPERRLHAPAAVLRAAAVPVVRRLGHLPRLFLRDLAWTRALAVCVAAAGLGTGVLPEAAFAQPPHAGEVPVIVEETRSRSGGWYPAAGAIYGMPLDSGVRDLYEGGPGLFAAMGYGLSERFGVEVRFDWFRSSGDPQPALAQEVESRLALMPLSAEIHFRLTRGRTHPYLLAGPAIVFSAETFTYRLLDDESEVTGRRTDLGGVLGAGFEARNDGLSLRAAVRAVFASGDRKILRATGRTDEGSGGGRPSLWTLSVEARL